MLTAVLNIGKILPQFTGKPVDEKKAVRRPVLKVPRRPTKQKNRTTSRRRRRSRGRSRKNSIPPGAPIMEHPRRGQDAERSGGGARLPQRGGGGRRRIPARHLHRATCCERRAVQHREDLRGRGRGAPGRPPRRRLGQRRVYESGGGGGGWRLAEPAGERASGRAGFGERCGEPSPPFFFAPPDPFFFSACPFGMRALCALPLPARSACALRSCALPHDLSTFLLTMQARRSRGSTRQVSSRLPPSSFGGTTFFSKHAARGGHL